MANTYIGATKLWSIDTTGNISTSGIWIRKIVYLPAAANNDLIFTDTSDNNAIVLRAGASDATPIQLDFGDKGWRLDSLKCGTIDGGTAYVYVR